jgi:FkbM family methyltransferase
VRALLDHALDAARVAALRADVSRRLEAAAEQGRLLILGSAALPRRILHAAGGRVAAMVEFDARFWGRAVDGVPVLSLPEALARVPEPLVLVGIWSPGHSHAGSAAWLAAHGVAQVLPVQAAFWHWRALGEHYQLAPPDELLAAAPSLRALHAALADDASRAALAGNLAWRLGFDAAALPCPEPARMYFDRTRLRLPGGAVVADGGAFAGDALAACLRWQGAGFARYLAFEPDPLSAARFAAFRDALPGAIAARVELHAAALGAARGETRLTPSGTAGTIAGEAGTHGVPLVALDDVLDGARLDCIKLDTEGWEAAALAGAARSIAAHQPVVTAAAYHRPLDILELPEWAMQALPGAALHLSQHDVDGIDLVMTAVPARYAP